MKELVISEIQILPLNKPQDGLVAFCSCIITCSSNNQFFIGNIGLHTSFNSPDGFRLVFPSLKLSTGKQINCVYPINRETYEAIKQPIIQKFEELMKKFASDHYVERRNGNGVGRR